MTGTKFGFIHTYIYTYIFLKPIILTQEPQNHRNSSKSLIRKFSPLQSFLFEKATPLIISENWFNAELVNIVTSGNIQLH